MLRRLRPRAPSLPTAISLLALFIVLGGTAFAATGQLVNITDPVNTANKAKVSAAGALSTAGTVSGSVAPAPPAKPFNINGVSFSDGAYTAQFSGTTATLAFTGVRIANGTPNTITYSLYRYSQPTGTSGCPSTGSATFLGQWIVPAGTTSDEQLTTPMIVKPPTAGSPWCLATYVSYSGGSTGYGLYTNFNGYIVSGTFATAAAVASPKNAPARPPTR